MYIEEWLFRFAILWVVEKETFLSFIEDYKNCVAAGQTLTDTF